MERARRCVSVVDYFGLILSMMFYVYSKHDVDFSETVCLIFLLTYSNPRDLAVLRNLKVEKFVSEQCNNVCLQYV